MEAEYLVLVVDCSVCPWIHLFDIQVGKSFTRILWNALRLAAYSSVLFVLGTDHCYFCIVSRYARWHESLVSMLKFRKRRKTMLFHIAWVSLVA